jgi:class 3 adenylate cyclase
MAQTDPDRSFVAASDIGWPRSKADHQVRSPFSRDAQRLKARAPVAPVDIYCTGEEPSVPVHPVERKLAAIFAADIAGYSRLMARDEVDTLARLKACRAIIDQLIEAHRGRIFNTAGDSVVG